MSLNTPEQKEQKTLSNKLKLILDNIDEDNKKDVDSNAEDKDDDSKTKQVTHKPILKNGGLKKAVTIANITSGEGFERLAMDAQTTTEYV